MSDGADEPEQPAAAFDFIGTRLEWIRERQSRTVDDLGILFFEIFTDRFLHGDDCRFVFASMEQGDVGLVFTADL